MLERIFYNYDEVEKTSFEGSFNSIKQQISNKFPNFDVVKNELLIRHFLILRNSFVSSNLSVSEESEMNKVFDNEHSEVIDNSDVIDVLKFITERTAKPTI